MSRPQPPLAPAWRRLLPIVIGLPLLAGLVACAGGAAGEAARAQGEEGIAAPATLVGGQACAGCHPREAELWRGSHHDLAMQEATPAALLGTFEDASGARARADFVRRGEASMVRAAGAEGQERELPVAFTFGVEPLQQLLVPGPGGRFQAFATAWDSRPRAAGGQRWFALDGGAPGTAEAEARGSERDANWNSMCAECHSTGLRKGYDPSSGRFETRWSEIDVSCEACHGPGSRHLAWARRGGSGDAVVPANHGFAASLRDPNRGAWVVDPETGSARRTAPLPARSEVDTCARCHSRRTALVESDATGGPLLDSHRPALLEEGLYHPDGQIDGEVFEYGSFLQSRMHAKGVSCSDCHEPHSGLLRFEGNNGNATCGSCHSPARFDQPEHHHHPQEGPQAVGCVDCHMPTRRYMRVDDRRDHSLRVPRPDLTQKIGAPNACNGCHSERSAAWAQAAVVRWYGTGRSSRPHYGEAIAAGRRGDSGAGARLLSVAADREVPAIARATALSLLARAPEADEHAFALAARDPEPLVRFGAAQGAMGLPPTARLAAIGGLLRDPLRAVREEAARGLLPLPPGGLPVEAQAAFAAALAELRASLALARERPEVLLELGGIALARGELAAAEEEYRGALRLDPGFVAAYANLAEAFRLQGREADVERVLTAGIARAPRAAPLHHALGLALVRQGRLAEAIAPLRRAAALAPDEARFAQVLDLAERELGSASQTTAGRVSR